MYKEIREIRKILNGYCYANGCADDGTCRDCEDKRLSKLISEHDSELIKTKEEIIKQYKWERDVAISQLETIGASFGMNMNLWFEEHDTELLDKVAEQIKIRLIDNLGLEDATKYGNKNAKQQANSYATVMKYEIADCVDDLLDDLAKMKAEVK